VEKENKSKKISQIKDYSKFNIDELFIYALYHLIQRKKNWSIENLIAECFQLFPKKFGMHLYPQWPDSRRVEKSWRRCRSDKKWLIGKPGSGFKLTPIGEKIAREIERKLFQHKKVAKKESYRRPRNREDALIKYIRQNPVFKRYQENPKEFTLNEMEFRFLLNTTMETPPEVVKGNFQYCLGIAKTVGDREVERFLIRCGEIMKEVIKGG